MQRRRRGRHRAGASCRCSCRPSTIGHGMFLTSLGLLLVVVPAWRMAFDGLTRDPHLEERVLIVGTGPIARASSRGRSRRSTISRTASSATRRRRRDGRRRRRPATAAARRRGRRLRGWPGCTRSIASSSPRRPARPPADPGAAAARSCPASASRTPPRPTSGSPERF